MDIIERLHNLDNKQLMDIIKNYRQYGYDQEIRNTSIAILEERGVSEEHLRLTGNLENKNYNDAIDLFDAYKLNSKIALILYVLILLNNLLIPIITANSKLLLQLGSIGNWMLFIFYFIFLVKSFIKQDQFYKKINKNAGTENALVYLFLGMPLYILAYFYFKNQMEESMKEMSS